MKLFIYTFCLLFSLLLTGCFTCMSSWCLGEETYQRLMYPKHYIEWWDKPSMTVEGRRQDWVECGGLSDGDFSPSARKIEEEMTRAGVDKYVADTRLRYDFQRCMISKGYRYTGDCTDKILKTRPLCGGS